ncbi:hypothetical protein HPB51_028655 [Rhipicephalus microplus]|uniref:Uncharacterized protein n=1 Tax=Rhipicephalus microplus TaxID=6941 RepID=A0A9J6CWG1_RHIMP|nr:hypothetical protein HPB51_028655 [Rhipicephalus microplus]
MMGISNFNVGRDSYYVNGRQVRGYHLVNATLHCACSVLMAVVARRVMRTAVLHACLAAMLFTAHPVRMEAAWILQASFPEFSKMDNPASFSSSRITRSGIRDLPRNAKIHYNCANLQKDTGNTVLAVKHYRLEIEDDDFESSL